MDNMEFVADYQNTVPPTDPVAELRKTPSVFTGTTIACIGITLLTGFVSFVSLGFAYLAMFCFFKRWYYSNTIINGYRMRFTGSGGQLFGKYILWTFLSIVTCGIFSLWLPVKYMEWETKHIEIDSIVKE